MAEDDTGLTVKENHRLARQGDLAFIGVAANQAAAHYSFADYRQRRAKKTIRTQTAALLLWVQYLEYIGAATRLLADAATWADGCFTPRQQRESARYAETQAVALPQIWAAAYCQNTPAAWEGITWGLVEGYVKWLLTQGYSIATVNNRLSAIKVYTRLAAKAGVITPAEQALIREVRGYGATEGKRVDEVREQTRVGYKKETAVVLTAQQASQLKKKHPTTPQGIRDRLMIALFLDLGLRASEVAGLRVEDLAERGYATVHRQKTDTTDRMKLSADIMQALQDYRPFLRQSGILLRGSRKNGQLTDEVMSVRAIGSRIKLLGRDILGVWELSPHDLRHTWATQAARNSSPFVLRDAGGWSNMQTPSRYVERAEVVNEGIELDY
ncbi:MAG: site-specific integrase [Chloroflexi bacterium]|nr:site-specific integrase [Chloroflexota bacterium]